MPYQPFVSDWVDEQAHRPDSYDRSADKRSEDRGPKPSLASDGPDVPAAPAGQHAVALDSQPGILTRVGIGFMPDNTESLKDAQAHAQKSIQVGIINIIDGNFETPEKGKPSAQRGLVLLCNAMPAEPLGIKGNLKRVFESSPRRSERYVEVFKSYAKPELMKLTPRQLAKLDLQLQAVPLKSEGLFGNRQRADVKQHARVLRSMIDEVLGEKKSQLDGVAASQQLEIQRLRVMRSSLTNMANAEAPRNDGGEHSASLSTAFEGMLDEIVATLGDTRLELLPRVEFALGVLAREVQDHPQSNANLRVIFSRLPLATLESLWNFPVTIWSDAKASLKDMVTQELRSRGNPNALPIGGSNRVDAQASPQKPTKERLLADIQTGITSTATELQEVGPVANDLARKLIAQLQGMVELGARIDRFYPGDVQLRQSFDSAVARLQEQISKDAPLKFVNLKAEVLTALRREAASLNIVVPLEPGEAPWKQFTPHPPATANVAMEKGLRGVLTNSQSLNAVLVDFDYALRAGEAPLRSTLNRFDTPALLALLRKMPTGSDQLESMAHQTDYRILAKDVETLRSAIQSTLIRREGVQALRDHAKQEKWPRPESRFVEPVAVRARRDVAERLYGDGAMMPMPIRMTVGTALWAIGRPIHLAASVLRMASAGRHMAQAGVHSLLKQEDAAASHVRRARYSFWGSVNSARTFTSLNVFG